MTPHADHARASVPISPDMTMRAVVHERYGGPEVVQVASVERPVPADREVLVRVHAAGVDRGVCHVMRGMPYAARLAFGMLRPRHAVLGFDLAGTVAAVGPQVTEFAVGDEVYGTGRGSFAEYAAAPAASLARKPANLSFAQSAVVPVSAVTALTGLRDVGRLRDGQRVLVTGASGGVGGYAVQIAKALGANVTGVASTAKLDLVRSLGADQVVDYTRQDFADGAHRYDLILDVAGNPSIARLRRALTPTGTAVITGGEEGGRITGMRRQLAAVGLSPFLRQRLTMFIGTVRSAPLEQLTDLIEAGAVTPALDRTYPLDRAAEALRHLESGAVRGKLALTV
jgi:NADPH:quinone reductase-like Zn-dependent oxidoreductase